MLLQVHATAAWLWIVSRRLCLGQDGSHHLQSGPCQHSRSWLHRAIFSLVALILARRRRHRKASEGRSVAPRSPRRTAIL